MDNTITEQPEFFAFLSKSVREKGGMVHIVSSRTRNAEVMEYTKEELEELGIEYDEIFLLPDMETAGARCPHSELNESQRYNWQKVHYCKKKDIGVFFDDHDPVIQLFVRYAPEVKVLKVCSARNVYMPVESC